jgi:hypothetical protein
MRIADCGLNLTKEFPDGELGTNPQFEIRNPQFLSASVVNPFFGSAGFKACWLSFDTAREELRNPPERIFVDRSRQNKT